MAVKNKFDLSKILKEIKKEFNIDVPKQIAHDAKTFFQENFDKQGFNSGFIESWKPRKNKKLKHPILVKTGALKRSIRIREKNSKRISLVSNLPYSRIHNEGLMGLAWGKYPFQMPKRQFMGHSPALIKKIEERILITINNCFSR